MTLAADKLAPPGRVEQVRARRVLVVAPHYDDETLGCGGLLIQLAAAGAPIRVLFLSDSSGGVEDVDDRESYARRRRLESRRAGEVLGVGDFGELGIRDGVLASHVAVIAQGVRAAILEHQPDLVLVPSPHEATSDHLAAFAGLRRALAAAAADDALFEATRHTSILQYEVNQPLNPDLLVDVSAQVPVLEQAIACYESQLTRHPYREAALGLRSYRTYTLAPGVRAVEAYRRLRAHDLVTRPSETIGTGYVPVVPARGDRPRVSVIVRTVNRPERLVEALESLASTGYPDLEVVLVNDGGAIPSLSPNHSFTFVRVDLLPRHGRAAAAQAGVDAATGKYVAFLDDDDLVTEDHFDVLVGAALRHRAPVVYADGAVGVYDLREPGVWVRIKERFPYGRDFDRDLLLLDNYIPFNTVLVARDLLDAVGPFDTGLDLFEDWDLLIRLSERVGFHHVARVTSEYRHFVGSDQALGSDPRSQPGYLEARARVLEKHRRRLTPAALARATDILSSEAVLAREERDSTRAAVQELKRSPLRFITRRLLGRR